MNLEKYVRRAFLRRLVATARGRAHMLNLVVHAEEGDEAGVFDQLKRVVCDPGLRKTIARHQADEREHAGLYRTCLERNGVAPEPLPDTLLIIRRVAVTAGGAFATGAASQSANGISTDEDVVNTYALLLAIEERGVRQFPLIGREFRRIGDDLTADTFDRVTADEIRHTKYCHAIGRRYAKGEHAWDRAVAEYRAVEERAFRDAGLAGIALCHRQGPGLGQPSRPRDRRAASRARSHEHACGRGVAARCASVCCSIVATCYGRSSVQKSLKKKTDLQKVERRERRIGHRLHALENAEARGEVRRAACSTPSTTRETARPH